MKPLPARGAGNRGILGGRRVAAGDGFPALVALDAQSAGGTRGGLIARPRVCFDACADEEDSEELGRWVLGGEGAASGYGWRGPRLLANGSLIRKNFLSEDGASSGEQEPGL